MNTTLSIRESMAREANRKRWAGKKVGYPLWYKITVYGLYAVMAITLIGIAQAVAETRMWERLN